MRKNSLSNFNCISIRELPTWVQVLQAEEPKPDKLEILQDLTLIDDLLIIMKSQSLLRKKRNLKNQLERRIDFDLGFIKPNR